MKKKRMKQAFTSSPKDMKGAQAPSGKKKTAPGHKMGGLFGMTPQRSEPENTPRTRAKERSTRRSRLANRFI